MHEDNCFVQTKFSPIWFGQKSFGSFEKKGLIEKKIHHVPNETP